LVSPEIAWQLYKAVAAHCSATLNISTLIHTASHSFQSRVYLFSIHLTVLTFISPTATMIFGSLSTSLVTLLAAASTVVSAKAITPNPTFTGLGTRYGDADGCTEENCWQKGACSFVDYKLPPGIDGSTCVSEDIWDNGANCGGCIQVSYKSKTLKIMGKLKTTNGCYRI
jgi:hypothetical protein